MPESAATNFLKDVVAGGTAGVAEICLMFPLDTVKTRLQLQTKGSEKLYKGVGDCLKTIAKEEGVASLYRGIISPILAEGPKRACKFAFNEFYRDLLRPKDGSELGTLRYGAAGSLAGMTEALINTPFEVLKVRMQAKENLSKYKNTFHAGVELIKKEGPLAIYSGLEAQMWRNGVWNGVYFAMIPFLKSKMLDMVASGKDSSGVETHHKLIANFIAGSIGGGCATSLNTPFDVAKSRMQNQIVERGQAPKYRHCLQTLSVIAQEEGMGALYKGYYARMLRLVPGGGIMILAFEVVRPLLG